MTDRCPRLANDLTVEQRNLWQRINDFSFDDESAVKSFSSRLAIENGWSREFTERVLNEYRRFLFLTAVAGHVVCPSEEVDAAWHQHMIYSRSYWDDLCKNTLGYPLHHNPTAGGSTEARKHWVMYRETIDSYRRIFGEDPPRDIWPLTFERFDPNSQPRMVDLRDHWIVRKPGWWPQRVRRRASAAACLVPLVAVGLGPLDLKGPEFLVMYVCLSVILFVGVWIYREMRRDVPITEDLDLTPEEIACLHFGKPATVNATIAGMLSANELISVPSEGLFGQTVGSKVTFIPGPMAPPQNQTLASAIYDAAHSTRPMTLAQLQKSTVAKTEAIEERLRDAGYLLNTSQIESIRIVPIAALLGLIVLGVSKIVIGIDRGKPVEFLISLCFLVLVAFGLSCIMPRRSKGGNRMLNSLRAQNEGLKLRLKQPDYSRQQLILGTALFGAAALDGTAFSDLRAAWKSVSTGGGNIGNSHGCGGGCGGGGGGAAGCGGGGCGGGGCGGGGCGGGGCGGCGG